MTIATVVRMQSPMKTTATESSLECATAHSYGALELTKCQYHLMDWDFTIAGAPILNTGTNDNHIDLISPVGDELCIKQLGCGTLYKTLGIFVNQTPPTSKHGV
jgi:hypothetical protein